MATSLSPHVCNQISLAAFLTALISAILCVALMVGAFFMSLPPIPGFVEPPSPVSIVCYWLSLTFLAVFILAYVTTIFTVLWGWWKGYDNSYSLVWRSVRLVLAVSAALPPMIYVIRVMIEQLQYYFRHVPRN